MLSLPKFGLSENAEKHVFVSFNLNNSEKYRLSFEDIFLGTLDTYAKKNDLTLDSFFFGGGGVHGKVSWLIAYTVYRCECV